MLYFEQKALFGRSFSSTQKSAFLGSAPRGKRFFGEARSWGSALGKHPLPEGSGTVLEKTFWGGAGVTPQNKFCANPILRKKRFLKSAFRILGRFLDF